MTTATRKPTTPPTPAVCARRVRVLSRPAGFGQPGVIRLAHYREDGAVTADDWTFTEVATGFLAGRGFVCTRVHASEYDHAEPVYCYADTTGSFCDPTDEPELLQAVTALLTAGLI